MGGLYDGDFIGGWVGRCRRIDTFEEFGLEERVAEILAVIKEEVAGQFGGFVEEKGGDEMKLLVNKTSNRLA
jgi:hypothetical protein